MHFFQAFALIMFVSKDVLLNIRVLTQLSFTCSKLTIETVEQVWNMFKVNHKDTRTTFVVIVEHI